MIILIIVIVMIIRSLAKLSDSGVEASRWAECHWANIMEVRSTDRSDSSCSLFAEKKGENSNDHQESLRPSKLSEREWEAPPHTNAHLITIHIYIYICIYIYIYV